MNAKKAKRIRALLGKEVVKQAHYQGTNQVTHEVENSAGTKVAEYRTCTISIKEGGRKTYKQLKKIQKNFPQIVVPRSQQGGNNYPKVVK